MRRGLAVVLAAGLLVAACATDDDRDATPAEDRYTSDVYADPVHWVCRPEVDDVCSDDLDATVISTDGVVAVEGWEPAGDPPVDCFYVYPTISQDEGPNSDLEASDREEGFATRNQAARLGEVCRVFAPVYRQVTAPALARWREGQRLDPGLVDVAYADVVDAWRHYLDHDNDGRGVVLVGHSQGAGMLGRLIAEEIDPQPAARDLLVSALLAGWPPPRAAGGDTGEFTHVPLCARSDQIGCVVTWSTFRDSQPPVAETPFGRARSGPTAGACVNPAAPEGGRAVVTAYLPDFSAPFLGDLVGEVHTPFVAVTGVIEAECASTGDHSYLAVNLNEIEAFGEVATHEVASWGMHVVDMSLVLGDLVDLVESQSAAYLAGS